MILFSHQPNQLNAFNMLMVSNSSESSVLFLILITAMVPQYRLLVCKRKISNVTFTTTCSFFIQIKFFKNSCIESVFKTDPESNLKYLCEGYRYGVANQLVLNSVNQGFGSVQTQELIYLVAIKLAERGFSWHYRIWHYIPPLSIITCNYSLHILVYRAFSKYNK